MSADNTLDMIDALIERLDTHDRCPRCGTWHKLHPRFDVARYHCCGVTREVNLGPHR